MAQVDIIELSKYYKETLAVDSINLTVEDKEFLVLLGPSGCGKSTILRMIAGLETITSGEIYIGDELVNYRPPKARNIAMVFQNYALYPHMMVEENIGFPLKMAGSKQEALKEAVGRVARTLRLEQLLQRLPAQLSGGQRQRVALGRATIRDPYVFLMDEPLSNLDATLRVQMRGELLNLHERLQTTIIYVTHDQVEAMTMGHRIVVMNEGHIQQVGPPQAVYDLPVNTFVASFLGSPTINLLRNGELEHANGKWAFRSPSLVLPLGAEVGERLSRVQPPPGEKVTLGIRPEDVTLQANNGAGLPSDARSDVRGEVHLIEPIGSDKYVTIRLGSEEFMARTSPRFPVHREDIVNLRLEWAHTHIFDAKGRNLFAEPS
jgi:multiple sugar transport system ATP-binding protein